MAWFLFWGGWVGCFEGGGRNVWVCSIIGSLLKARGLVSLVPTRLYRLRASIHPYYLCAYTSIRTHMLDATTATGCHRLPPAGAIEIFPIPRDRPVPPSQLFVFVHEPQRLRVRGTGRGQRHGDHVGRTRGVVHHRRWAQEIVDIRGAVCRGGRATAAVSTD